MDLFGPLGIAVIAIVAVVVLVVAGLILRWRFSGHRRAEGRGNSAFFDQPRVQILETHAVDEMRQIVLVRCDEIEHLIMIGGPTDVVVENDVRKVRAPTAATAELPGLKAPAPSAPPRVPASVEASLDAAFAAVAPRSAEPARSRPAPRSPIAAIPQPADHRSAHAETQPPVAHPREDVAPAPAARAASDAPRRDTPARRLQPAPMQMGRPGDVSRPAASAAAANGESERPIRPAPPQRETRPLSVENGALPAADVPWAQTASIEDEIVQALRSEPRSRSADPQPAPPRPDDDLDEPRAIIDSSATLGDLADRLEEALAREIQTSRAPAPAPAPARPSHMAEGAATNSRSEPEAARPKRPAVSRERPERRERMEPVRAAEPEPRREPAPERREEAPVISLNARRRENADPLEDEMARLLGELTGDTKGR